MKRATLMLAAFALLLGSVGQATAGPLPVVNASFEADPTPFYTYLTPTGWNFLAGGSGGVFRPNNTYNGGNGNYMDPVAWPTGAPDGIQVAFVNGTLAQTTSTAAVAGATYSLDVYVGTQNNIGPASNYNVSLFDGNTLIASTSGIAPVNEYQLVSISGVGMGLGNLSIELTGFQQTLFDDVQLSSAPEPASLTLLGISLAGLVGYGWRRRKPAAIAAL